MPSEIKRLFESFFCNTFLQKLKTTAKSGAKRKANIIMLQTDSQITKAVKLQASAKLSHLELPNIFYSDLCLCFS